MASSEKRDCRNAFQLHGIYLLHVASGSSPSFLPPFAFAVQGGQGAVVLRCGFSPSLFLAVKRPQASLFFFPRTLTTVNHFNQAREKPNMLF